MKALSTLQEKYPLITTRIHFYSMRSGPEYTELKEKLTAIHGKRFFKVISPKTYWKNQDEEIVLETHCLFDNQWNSKNGHRVFDWYENVDPQNREFHRGHYLEITEEMKQLRDGVYKCRYCGAYSDGPGFHEHDLGGEYMTEQYLPVMRFMAVSDRENVPALTEEEKDYLLPKFEVAQRERLRLKAIKYKADKISELTKKRVNLEVEMDGMITLLNNGIDTENCIYYNHTGKFCFGWRTRLTATQKADLEYKLEQIWFKYPVEFKS